MKTRTEKFPAIQFRDVILERTESAVEGEPQKYHASLSSEAPVRQFNWITGEAYIEILSHDPADIDFSRVRASDGQLPLHETHWFGQIGSVRDVVLNEKRRVTEGDLVFSANEDAQKKETLVREKHLKGVSMGYRILPPMKLLSRDPKTGIPTYLCRWMPMEVCTASMAADLRIGIGREADGKETIEVTVEDRTEERTMDPNTGTQPNLGTQTPAPAQPAIQTRTEAAAPVPSPAAAAMNLSAQPAPMREPITGGRDGRAEALAIMELAEAHKLGARAPEWLRKGLSREQVRDEILEAIRTKGPGQPGSEQVDRVMSEKDWSRYSVARAVQMQVEIKDGERRSIDGIEAEVHQELTKHRAGIDHGGILVQLRTPEGQRLYQERLRMRTLGTTEPTGGATLVGAQYMDLIDLLRNKAMVLLAGAKFSPGLTGNLIFPIKTGAPTHYWMGENPAAGAAASQPYYGYTSASPKTMIGTVLIPRQLLVQAFIDVEADVRNDLSIGGALAIDLAALHGKGTDKQPGGVYAAAGIQAHPIGGVPSLTKITDMVGLLAAANANVGMLSWMTTPQMAAVLMRTPLVDGYPQFVWTGPIENGQVFGMTARATNQMSKTLGAGGDEHGFVYANWNDARVCMWGNQIELVVDVVTRADEGQIKVTSYQMADIVFERPVSFVKGTGAKIA